MDKIIFMNINIIDHDEMIIIQSMIHITGQDFSSIFKDSSTTGLLDPGFTTILSQKWILIFRHIGSSSTHFRIIFCRAQIHYVNSFRENFHSVQLYS